MRPDSSSNSSIEGSCGVLPVGSGLKSNPSSGSFFGRVVCVFKRYNEPVVEGSYLAVNAWNALLNTELIVPLQTALNLFTNLIGSSVGRSESSATSTRMTNLIGNTKLLIGVSIPCALVTMAQCIRNFTVAKCHDEKVNTAFEVVECVGWLGDSTASFFRGLVTNGYAVSAVSSVILPLAVASAILSSVTVIKNAKNWAKSAQLLSNIENAQKVIREDGRSAAQDILTAISKTTDFKLKYHFKVADDGSSIRETIGKVVTVSKEILLRDPSKIKVVDSNLDRFLVVLKDRIVAKNFSHKLAMLSMAMSLVGLAILICTVTAPVGFALLAVGSAISLSRFLYDQKKHDQFASELKKWKDRSLELLEEEVVDATAMGGLLKAGSVGSMDSAATIEIDFSEEEDDVLVADEVGISS